MAVEIHHHGFKIESIAKWVVYIHDNPAADSAATSTFRGQISSILTADKP
jgi:hypothetical protein